ncbi:MAG: zeta toxin family protein [Rhizobiales bacterium]|nr:zeta toxin family protein [Hyphomicrobiales bacterium]
MSGRTDPPLFLIVAGPNGSGKSSAYGNTDVESIGRSVWIINPDLLAARIRDVERLALTEANLEAVRRIERWLESSIEAHQSIGVETVLSTSKYRRLVEKAKGLGFEVGLIYVILQTPELNVERVRLRVLKGGHAVPEDKIVERYWRSLDQLPWFLQEADKAWLYDNSGASPKLIGQKARGTVTLDHDALAPIVAAVEKIRSN